MRSMRATLRVVCGNTGARIRARPDARLPLRVRRAERYARIDPSGPFLGGPMNRLVTLSGLGLIAALGDAAGPS
ncbi:hypothetical protein A7982_13032 [Minicystis rosea]|nr:hypothetical protein A7982_13032 [Minicystis rosea]